MNSYSNNKCKYLIYVFKTLQLYIYLTDTCPSVNVAFAFSELQWTQWFCEFESRSGMRCTTLCGKACQWLATSRWFSPCTPVFSTNKVDRHDITELLLKVAFNTIKHANNRETDHVRDHLWHRYSSVTVHQVMLATVKHSKWLFKLTN